MLRLEWRDSASIDLEQIVEYIAARNLAAALRLRSAIVGCAEQLASHPYMYRRGRAPGTREAMVHPNYIVIYRVRSDAVEIVRVIHSRQQYP